MCLTPLWHSPAVACGLVVNDQITEFIQTACFILQVIRQIPEEQRGPIITVTSLEQRVPVVFLVIMHETDARLVILFAFLITELADVTACLARFAAVPRLDHLRACAKRAKSALARHERRVLPVSEQPPHDRAAGIGVFGRRIPTASYREGLRVVAPHAAMADAVA